MSPIHERPTFPVYLTPAFSFATRRRQKCYFSAPSASQELSISCTSIASNSASHELLSNSLDPLQNSTAQPHINPALSPSCTPRAPSSALGRIVRSQPDTLKCLHCAADIAFTSQIVSKGFTGRHGRAYLVAPPSPDKVSAIPPFPPTKPAPKNLCNMRIGRSVTRDLMTGTHIVADVSCLICNAVLGWKYVDAKERAQRYKIGKFILETKRVVSSKGWEDADSNEEVDDTVLTREEEDEEGFVLFDSEDEAECDELFSGIWDADTASKRRERRANKMKEGRKDDSDSS